MHLLLGFPLSALILSAINIAIVVAILLLVGALILWLMNLFGYPVPVIVQKLYMLIVALVALYLIIGLLFGLPVSGPLRL